MRIFLTLHPSANFSVPGSMTWYHNLYEPLIDIGHEVVLLRLDEVARTNNVKLRSNKFKEIFSSELVSFFSMEHLKKPFDLFFSYITDKDVHLGALETIKRIGIPMANFSCNNTHQFYLIENISPLFDYNLHSEKSVAEKFKSINAFPVWFPMAANPYYYYPMNLPFKYDVSFIGAAYSKRSYYIWHLLESGIKTYCFGPNWLVNRPNQNLKKGFKELKRFIYLMQSLITIDSLERFSISSDIKEYDLQLLIRKRFADKMNYPLSDVEVIKAYSQSRINLGFLEVNLNDNTSGSNLSHHLHLREFEVPMSRGLYITNFSEELAEFYELDKEVLVFYNEHDLTDKIKYYLKHEKEADSIREKGFQRAINNHTYQKRFKDLFIKVNL
jgi:spore maturation protein CgeB